MAGASGDAPASEPPARVTDVSVSVRSALAIMSLLALTVLALEIARHSERVIAWILSAGAIAVLVYPAVNFAARWLPRAVAVVLVLLIGLGAIGFLGYRLVHDVTQATDRIQQAAPRRAAELEKHSDFLRTVHLQRRVQRLVDDIPGRLAGGSATNAFESAATRGVAVVAGLILTIFYLLYGPRLFDAGLGQIGDASRRRYVERVVVQGTRRGLDYARVQLLESLIEGVLAYTIARAAGVPGPAALGAWVALWTLLPVAGVFVGALPIVLFAGATSTTRAIVVALAFVAIGTAEFLFETIVERQVVEVSSFLIVFAAFGGLELDGLTGALLGILGVIVLVAILDEAGRVDRELEAAAAAGGAPAAPPRE
jgi:predicted PurR-regulated permease PerM